MEGRNGPNITGIFGSMRPGGCDAIRFKRYILYFCASIVEKIRSEEKCTKQYSLLSVFLQTDQMWRLMWSSGFHFCLFSSPVRNLKRVSPIQPWTTNGTQRRVKLICDTTSDCLLQFTLSSAWSQKEKTQ